MNNLVGSIVVVGNAPSEVGRGRGPEIDAADTVIRFNDFRLDGFERDYGTKTDLWSSTFWAMDGRGHVQRPEFSGRTICPLPLDAPEFLEKYHHQKYHGGHDLEAAKAAGARCMPFEFFERLLALDPLPSSGLMILWWLYCIGKIGQVRIYGFNFFSNAEAHHYYKDHDRNVCHKAELERLLVLGMMPRGNT